MKTEWLMVFQGIQVAAVTFEGGSRGFCRCCDEIGDDADAFSRQRIRDFREARFNHLCFGESQIDERLQIPLRTKFLCKRQRLGNGVNRRSIDVEHVLRLVTEGRGHVVVMVFKERIHKMAVMIAVLI